MRSLDDIRQRPHTAPDFFGWEHEVLAIYLPECMVDGKAAPLTEETVKAEMLGYLAFAFDKAFHHRGISANRSAIKLRAWLWLLEDAETLAFAENKANYPYYGMPILKAVARKYGAPIPPEAEAWIDGQPCNPYCDDCCGDD